MDLGVYFVGYVRVVWLFFYGLVWLVDVFVLLVGCG